MLTAIPEVKTFSINTKEYSNIFKMFARTILAFSNVSSPYERDNTLNSQVNSRSAKRDEVPGPERRAGIRDEVPGPERRAGIRDEVPGPERRAGIAEVLTELRIGVISTRLQNMRVYFAA